MPQINKQQYRFQVLGIMAVYVALTLLVWPHARHAENLALKAVLAVIPTLPVMVVLWLMARRVMNSDELQQRLHLFALSTATGVVAALSLVGGFLCAAGVFDLSGDILIWVFPALCLSYGLARVLFARRYGGVGCE